MSKHQNLQMLSNVPIVNQSLCGKVAIALQGEGEEREPPHAGTAGMRCISASELLLLLLHF
jgi:hypothetical protein